MLANKASVIAWSVFLIVLLGASWFKAAENRRDAQVQAEWQERITRLREESQGEFKRLTGLLQSVQGAPLSRRKLEAELNGGRPLDLVPKGSRDEARWTHPIYGISVRLSFENDVLRGFHARSGSPSSLPENAQPKLHRFNSRAEAVRKAAKSVSVVAWMAAMLLAIASRKYSWLAAQVMLASALAFGAATVVSPAYSLTFRGIFSNDPMIWAVLMYLMALMALAKTWPTIRLKPQVQLSRLLLAMTVIVLLLAMGPLGYFALAVFTTGGLLLVGMLALRPQTLR